MVFSGCSLYPTNADNMQQSSWIFLYISVILWNLNTLGRGAHYTWRAIQNDFCEVVNWLMVMDLQCNLSEMRQSICIIDTEPSSNFWHNLCYTVRNFVSPTKIRYHGNWFQPQQSNNLLHLSLQWRHNGRDSVSNHQPHDIFLNRLFRHRSKKTSKLRVTGLCAGNSPEADDFPAQMASNAENVSIWWRHHVMR